jgi:hypothetical protein
MDIITNKKFKTYSSSRLEALELKYQIHQHLNERKEEIDCQLNDQMDFNRLTKVDTHIHMTAAYSAADLCSYIKSKLLTAKDDVVLNGRTLGEVCAAAELTPSNITIDRLDVQGDVNIFDRFDLFNDRYLPSGSSDLKSIFMGYQNDVKGR